MKTDQIRKQCWDRAVHCFGTGYIFEQRKRRLSKRLTILTTLGILVPLTVGAIALSLSSYPSVLPLALSIAGILGVLQLIGSGLSLGLKWDTYHSEALESLTHNHRLANSYQKLAKNPPTKLDNLESQFELLEMEFQLRSDLDYKQEITEDEKREGLRAALRQFRRSCVECKEIPNSLKASNCTVCGNFKRKII